MSERPPLYDTGDKFDIDGPPYLIRVYGYTDKHGDAAYWINPAQILAISSSQRQEGHVFLNGLTIEAVGPAGGIIEKVNAALLVNRRPAPASGPTRREELAVREIVKLADEKGIHIRMKGGQYSKHGVPLYEECFEEIGIDFDALPFGASAYNPPLNVIIELERVKTEGGAYEEPERWAPRRVVGLASPATNQLEQDSAADAHTAAEAAHSVKEAAAAVHNAVCADCGAEVTTAMASASTKAYKRVLCQAHMAAAWQGATMGKTNAGAA